MDPQATLDRVMVVLADAQGDVESADWSRHDQAINAIMDSTTLFYLRTDPQTGAIASRVRWPADGTNYGMVASLVAPLVALLRAQTDAIDDLVKKIPGASEDAAWAHWKARLAQYEAALASVYADGDARDLPNKVVWDRVTAPLLLGYFPADFTSYGIANPAAKSRPDVTWTATTTFQIALSSTIRKQNWAQLWVDLGHNAKGVIVALAKAPQAIVEGITEGVRAVGKGAITGAKILGAAAVLGGGLFLLSSFGSSRRD